MNNEIDDLITENGGLGIAKAPAMVSGAVSSSMSGEVARVRLGNRSLQPANAASTSQYSAPRPQPPNTISDVDTGANWWSPLQPLTPFGPPGITYPREWDYPSGYNIDYTPTRSGFFELLRAMTQTWGLLRTVIETRKDEFMRIPWNVVIKGKPEQTNARREEVLALLRKPDGKNRWDRWCRLLLDDLLVIDAPTIYTWRRNDGKPYALQVLDGATIFPLVDDAGRRPDAPSPAYQQIIKGLPMVDFDETEIIYAPMRPRPQMPIYGYPPTEQILVEVSQGINRAMYQANFWREGTMPEMIVTVPDGWTAPQIAQFQGYFDTLLAGNVKLKSRVRFVPTGMKPFDIKNANGDGLKADYDEWLARIVCFAYSISPQPFVKQMNRATAETAQETAEKEGLLPLLTWFKTEIGDPIVQELFGYDDMEFNFLPQPNVDQQKQMTVLMGYVKDGVMSRNEVRGQLKLEKMDGADDLTVDTPNGPVPVAETVEANRQIALQAQQSNEPAQQNGASAQSNGGEEPPAAKNPRGVGKYAGAPFRQTMARPASACLSASGRDRDRDHAEHLGVGVRTAIEAGYATRKGYPLEDGNRRRQPAR